MRKYGLRTVALGYLLVVLLGPLSMVFWRAFDKGAGHLWSSLSDPNTIHAFKLTLIITAIAVPLNTLFGVLCALAIVRRRFPGAGIVNALVDLPLALSPVVVGLSLFLLYGRTGWFGAWFQRHGIQMLFALPSMVISCSRLPAASASTVPSRSSPARSRAEPRPRRCASRTRTRTSTSRARTASRSSSP